MIALDINGRNYLVDVEDDMPLLWVLRDTIGLTGTKFGCGAGLCGACTVIVKGQARRSCVTPVATVAGTEITTIEGLVDDTKHPVVAAWLAEGVPQCGYCQPGQMMAATALLRRTPNPTDAEIDLSMTNICRCGTYGEIRKAIHHASDLSRGVNGATPPGARRAGALA